MPIIQTILEVRSSVFSNIIDVSLKELISRSWWLKNLHEREISSVGDVSLTLDKILVNFSDLDETEEEIAAVCNKFDPQEDPSDIVSKLPDEYLGYLPLRIPANLNHLVGVEISEPDKVLRLKPPSSQEVWEYLKNYAV